MEYALNINDPVDPAHAFSGRASSVYYEPISRRQATLTIEETMARRSPRSSIIGAGATAAPVVSKPSRVSFTAGASEAPDFSPRPKVVSAVDASSVADESEVTRIAAQRVKILAARYAAREGEISEILARLEILNQRLAHQVPRVTASQVEFLEHAAGALAVVEAQRQEMSDFLSSL